MVDGELNFITKLDKTGFDKGTKSINNGLGNLKTSLKSFAKVAAAAFSVKMIVDFAKASKDAYNEAVEAETKLTTIMKQRMNATDEQIESIKELAAEQQKLGVVEDDVQIAGAQQVATFLTQADSIKTLLPAMNDLLAQQRGLEASAGDAVNIANLMGKVLQGQTSALKRVGISFSDAEEQVLKYGSESERAAMLAQVITNNVGHMNQALAQTDAGKQKQLANTMGDIKEQFGQAVMQIESVFLPVIQLLADGLSKVASIAQRVGSAIKEAFGVESSDNSATIATTTATAAASAAESYEDMADSAEQTKKAQENSLASFDKVIKLGDSKDSGTSSGGSSGGTTITPVNPSKTNQDTSKLVKYVKSGLSELKSWTEKNFGGTFSHIWDGLKSNAKDSWENVKKVFGDVKTLGKPLKKVLEDDLIPLANKSLGFLGQKANDTWQNFNKAFNDIWNIAVFPMLQNFVTVGLPLLSNFFSGMLSVQKAVWDELNDLWNMLWDDVAKPVLEGIAGLWNDLWTIASEVWDEYGQPIIDAVCKAIEWVGTTIKDLWNSFLKPIWDWLCTTIKKLWKDHIAPLVKKIGELIGEVVLLVTNLWNNVLAPVVDWIIKTFGPVISKIITGIGDVIGSVIGTIIDVVSGVIDFFKGVVKFFSGIFTLDMGKAWDGIKTMFKGAWDAIKAIFSGVISFFTSIFSGAWEGIKAIWNGVKTFFEDIWYWIKKPFVKIGEWFAGVFSGAWSGIKTIWNKAKTFFADIWYWIKYPFVKAAEWFKGIFDKVAEKIKKIWKGIKDFIVGVWNEIKSIVEKITGTASSSLKNKTREALKQQGKTYTDAEWEQIWKTQKFAKGGVIKQATMALVGEDGAEVVMPLEKNTGWIDKLAQRIASKQRPMPQLATGTVVPANFGRFAAILGDNKREPEVVSPVSTIEDAVRKVLAEQGRDKQPIKFDIYLDTTKGKRLLAYQLIDDINDIITSTGKVPIKI